MNEKKITSIRIPYSVYLDIKTILLYERKRGNNRKLYEFLEEAAKEWLEGERRIKSNCDGEHKMSITIDKSLFKELKQEAVIKDTKLSCVIQSVLYDWINKYDMEEVRKFLKEGAGRQEAEVAESEVENEIPEEIQR